MWREAQEGIAGHLKGRESGSVNEAVCENAVKVFDVADEDDLAHAKQVALDFIMHHHAEVPPPSSQCGLI